MPDTHDLARGRLSADELDQPWLGDPSPSRKHDSGPYPGLYLFDATAYESLMVGWMPIFRCKSPYPGCPASKTAARFGNSKEPHPEFDSVFLGFSRDVRANTLLGPERSLSVPRSSVLRSSVPRLCLARPTDRC